MIVMDVNLKLMLLYFFGVPVFFGVLATNILFSLFNTFEIKYEKGTKLKCYLPIIALVSFFSMLVYISLWYHSYLQH